MSQVQEQINALNAHLPPNIQLTEKSDASMLWAALFRLYGDQVQGPTGHATWKDAAVSEFLAHQKAKAAR